MPVHSLCKNYKNIAGTLIYNTCIQICEYCKVVYSCRWNGSVKKALKVFPRLALVCAYSPPSALVKSVKSVPSPRSRLRLFSSISTCKIFFFARRLSFAPQLSERLKQATYYPITWNRLPTIRSPGTG